MVKPKPTKGYLPVYILAKTIVGGVHDNIAKAYGQREEDLGNSCIPHLRLQQLVPLWFQKVKDTIRSTRQSQGAHQQYQHDQVGEQSEKI